MTKEIKLLYLLKPFFSTALFLGAVYFENAQQLRLLLLIMVFCTYLVSGLARIRIKANTTVFYLTFYSDLMLIFLMEQNSRLLINYFFHSFYILVLLEAALTLERKKGIIAGAVAVLVSMVKYGYLTYYQFNFASLSQMAFFLLVSILILVIAGFAQHNREEHEKKDVLYKELLDTHRQLKQYSDEVNRLSVVEERNRIARDIHDTIGHNMTALIMQLQMAEHFYQENPKRAAELLTDGIITAKDSLSGIRDVVETLRGDEDSGYSADAIGRLAARFSERTGVDIRLDLAGVSEDDSREKKRNPAADMAIYRIVQEALTNAVRHGNATEISVKIEYLHGKIRFQILDNGSGKAVFKEGLGLKGIRERAEAFGGAIRIETGQGQGQATGQGFSLKGELYLEERND